MRRPDRRRVCLFTIVLMISGCADTRGGSIPYDRQLPAPDTMAMHTLGENYKIAPLDKLGVKAFRSADISGDYVVDLAGRISLPLIGEVEAANLTTEELDKKLTDLLGRNLFEHPDISVAIKESTAHVVTMDGAIHQAGQYPAVGAMTLMQAIALAHGTTENANPRRVAVFRTIDGRRQAAAFDLTAIRRGEAADPQIYAGDIVIVDGSSVQDFQRRLLTSIPVFNFFRPLLP